MIDRQLLVILAITGIMSTAVVSLLFHESVAGPIEVLREDWNLPREGGRILIPAEEGRFAYTLALVVRRPVAELVLGFALLENRTLDLSVQGITSGEVREIPEFGDWLGTIETYLTNATMESQAFEVELAQGQRRALVYDMTETFSALARPETLRNLATVHAFLRGPDDGSEDYFQGVKDFFVDRDDALVDLTIQENENLTKYGQRESAATGTIGIQRAPPKGLLRFEDLRRDDRVSITIAFNPARLSGRESLLQIVTIQVDGALEHAFAHLLERSALVTS